MTIVTGADDIDADQRSSIMDGNGKASKMLVNVLLMRSGYPPAISSATNRAQYLETLERAQAQGMMPVVSSSQWRRLRRCWVGISICCG
jgi:hypothetical protein